MDKENSNYKYYDRKNSGKTGNEQFDQGNNIERDTFNEFFSGKYQRDNISDEELNDARKKAKFLGEKASAFKNLIEMVSDAINGKFKINKATLAILIGAIIYVLSPVDLIPDWIPILGWIDDMAVIGFIISQYEEIINNWKAWKNGFKF